MTRRTPTQEHKLIRLAETESQRALGRSVSCDDCGSKIGKPCRARHGTELRAEHPKRLRKAERAAAAGVLACTFCQRLELTAEQRQVEPYPGVVEMCELHQRVDDEINEAREAKR